MKHLAHRCVAVASAAVVVAGLVTALTPGTASLPDVQIRDFGLSAATVNAIPAFDIVENHIRPDFLGDGGAESQQIDLGDLLHGAGTDAVGAGGAGATVDTGDLDPNLVNELAGGELDPQTLLLGGSGLTLDLGSFEAPSVGAFSAGGEQPTGSAVASSITGIGLALQVLPEAQQSINAAIVAVQMEFNSALVAAQQAAVDRLFVDSPELNDLVNWIFMVNNTVLAQNQAAFNSLLGITYDSHSSLVSGFAQQAAALDWGALLGFSPEEFDEIVNAIQSENLALLLGGIGWSDLFAGLF
ncbi:hypothetical protein [Mycolicibacter minnesotensis]